MLNRKNIKSVSLTMLLSVATLVLSGKVYAQGLHGIAFSKGCESPIAYGDPYTCTYSVANVVDTGDGAGNKDTLTITSLVDVVHANPSDVSSGNILPSLTLNFAGGATCNVAQTVCTLPPGSSITSDPYTFYTTDS